MSRVHWFTVYLTRPLLNPFRGMLPVVTSLWQIFFVELEFVRRSTSTGSLIILVRRAPTIWEQAARQVS